MDSRSYSSPLRDRSAGLTRQAILAAAGRLFAERGYARTSVAAIAEAAGVAVNTVYTSVGNKAAVLLALTRAGAADELAVRAHEAIARAGDAAEVLSLLAAGTARVRQSQERTLSVLLDNRDAHPEVAEAAALATRLVRERLADAAATLLASAGVREGLTRAEAERALWFYFGFPAWRTVRELGLGWDEGAEWLLGQAGDSLLARP
ncbi:AcrR family transcriptional regulator [Crossiella equi]|uniref:AcrR family transcriptional regulator n=1 Tax=Crossiella equi TaxID=130796 RepID=A0ABS5AB36_9PSEU|nr:TetR family transcriptional regulator [Crossiella equi]MBP2473790.1 AcrR family transcriptional regulator [Crossiella equi]